MGSTSNQPGFDVIIFIKFMITLLFPKTSGGRLNIKLPSHQYRDSHYKNKTVLFS